jgi:hypothetical protein
MKNTSLDIREDISNLLSESITAVQSSGYIWLDDFKGSVSSEISRIVKSALIKVLSLASIFVGGVYFVYFGVREVLVAGGVPALYTTPIFVCLLILATLFLRFFYSSNDTSRKATRKEDLRNIANFKYSLSDFSAKLKSILENPLGYFKIQTVNFFDTFDFMAFKKYKYSAIAVIAIGGIIGVIRKFGKVANNESLDLSKMDLISQSSNLSTQRGFNTKAEPVVDTFWDTIMRFFLASFIALFAGLLKDLITEGLSEVRRQVTRTSKN